MLASAELTAYAKILRSAEGVDEWCEEWERLHQRLAPRPPEKRLSIADICQAYEEATGTCVGCD
jgi:hypothetical protein